MVVTCNGSDVALAHRVVLAAFSSHFETALAGVQPSTRITLDVDTKITGKFYNFFWFMPFFFFEGLLFVQDLFFSFLRTFIPVAFCFRNCCEFFEDLLFVQDLFLPFFAHFYTYCLLF